MKTTTKTNKEETNMKTNQNTFFGIIAALIAVIFTLAAFAACPQTTEDKKCDCLVKIHDGDCGATCFGKGNAGCLCVDKIHPLNRGAQFVDNRTNVAEADLNAVFTRIEFFNGLLEGLGYEDSSTNNILARGITFIVENGAIDQPRMTGVDGKTIKVNFARIEGLTASHISMAIYSIEDLSYSAPASTRETIRLAKAPFDAKAFAKLVAAQVRSGRARA
jgi:hypothetical protein